MKEKIVLVMLAFLLIIVLEPSHRSWHSSTLVPQAQAESHDFVCNAERLHGRYALFGQGTLTQALGPLPVGPFSVIGAIDFDGTGNLAGSETDHFSSVNTEKTENRDVVITPTFTGTYSLDSHCAVTAAINATLDGQPLATFSGVGVIAEGGREIEFSTLNPGISDLRRAKRED